MARWIFMGVSGCGKSTVGRAFAEKKGIPFLDADDFHSEENKHKMAEGIPLTDSDREPWLRRLVEVMKEHEDIVLACSALEEAHREILREAGSVQFIYLKGSYALIHGRMEKRKEHFFNPELLQSQFDTLEEPSDAQTIDISQPISAIVNSIQ